MAETYTISINNFAASALKTAVSLLSSTTLRGKIIKIVFGQTSAPASSDVSSEWQLRRFTSDGTGSAPTAYGQMDPLGPANTLTGKVNYSAEPTYSTGYMFPIGINQRATYTWFPITEGEKFMTNLTASNGIGLQCVSAPASSVWSVAVFFEQ